jgi:hypothetical protein
MDDARQSMAASASPSSAVASAQVDILQWAPCLTYRNSLDPHLVCVTDAFFAHFCGYRVTLRELQPIQVSS